MSSKKIINDLKEDSTFVDGNIYFKLKIYCKNKSTPCSFSGIIHVFITLRKVWSEFCVLRAYKNFTFLIFNSSSMVAV